ncbi:acetylserotonin O-methyltransferase [Nonomuraea gerenzanensis]|uniref:O-methyltransferase, family 2 n=1 Tax=Nonomuraea gerenzanensis TaxID=93944 RepID=A0A1M4E2X3_9ACTN|nr:acetylserotonin O-methyltransferase [Nonomuraea gerenzanensis]UBU15405.1 acetylserotonin O-methyltransferase [Nonomuraea gerenzanensis]SBO93161.1 O-methyltransferase, family 2 [Nonomuraea gerenzanensis]
MPLFYNPLEAAAHRLSVVPPMFDYFGAMGLHALVAAARTGVFDALRERPSTAGDLAAALGLDPHATGVLLRALTGLGYLRVRGGRYRLTRTARRWLTTGSTTSLLPGLVFWERTARVLWPGLEQAVRDGAPARPFYASLADDPELSRSFHAWTAAVAARQAPAAARRIPVPRDARLVLDVGGGHGLFSLALLRRHPRLRATVIDLPDALPPAAAHPRLTPRAGSFLEDDLGSGYDVALLFNIVHGLNDEEAARLLRRVAAALDPGGVVVVGDQFGDSLMPGRASRALVHLLDLNYLVTVGGRVRGLAEVTGLLRAAGFGRVRHRRPLGSPTTELAIARKPLR